MDGAIEATKVSWLPAARRPTYYFLQFAKRFSPVFLTARIDVSQIEEHRRRNGCEGVKFSYIAYVIHAVARSLRQYPEANTSVRHSSVPQLARHGTIDAKFTLDKVSQGERVVVPGLIKDADQCSLTAIQERIDYFKAGSLEELDEFKNARLLRKLPTWVGQSLYNKALGDLRRRAKMQGNFTVTSLGHRPIDTFLPVISSTLCFGVGAASRQPVVQGDEVRIASQMTLSMGFDHCALDGGLAADLLDNIKQRLENPSLFGEIG